LPPASKGRPTSAFRRTQLVAYLHSSGTLRPQNTLTLYVAIIGLAAVVFAADLFTALGVAAWIFYFVPIGMTLLGRDAGLPILAALVCSLLTVVTTFTDQPGMTPWVAYLNRGFGIVVIWGIAFIARSHIVTRNQIEAEEWIRGHQTRLLEVMQGEASVSQIGDRALSVLAPAIDSSVAAVYALTGSELRLTAMQGLRPGTELPEAFDLGHGLIGEAARSGRITVLRDLPESVFIVRSAFLNSVPTHLMVIPLVADSATQGVLEMGLLRAPERRSLDLLERTRDAIAIAIRTAFFRDRLRTLLAETQRQSEALQAQQEELRVSNEELEQQGELLKSSQVRLEQQQAELEASNAQLEARTQELERQKGALLLATRDAERTSQYKSEFVANMSHELRTPLNSTLILAKLLAENKGGSLSAEQVRYAETIYASGNTLLTLINDILDLSKIEAGAIEVQTEETSPASIAEALSRTFQPIAAEKHLEFTVDVVPAAPRKMTTDPQRIQQILTNLLSNAFKFTERGGVILRVAPSGPEAIAFEVRDTGPGIPPDQQETIFEAFRQADGSTHRKHGGTGLGLSISRELAQLLGGDIHLSSQPGTGSTFTLTVPTELHTQSTRTSTNVITTSHKPPTGSSSRLGEISSPNRPTDGPTAAAARPLDDRGQRRHAGRLILVIEDDPAFAEVLYKLAHELDYDSVVAGTNDEGMALARDLSPSGILLDINLPDGSGLTLLDRLKRNPDTRHIPVHVISVSDSTQTALALGAVGYALKPVDREDLVGAIRKLEARLDQRVRRVLVVEDDEQLRASIKDLLQFDGVSIRDVATAGDALTQLATESFDCVVLDLHLPDATGFEVLETMSASEQYSFPPVIIYTGRQISREEEERLRRFSRSVIVKGARSPERLLDEVTLFLHQVESRLPPDARRRLQAARERDEFFEGRTILVVEDDVRNIFALTSVFEPRGAKVVIARNGREGVKQALKVRPHLVLMDIMMPEMDGLAATRELRQHPEFRDLPIIALTAKAMRDDYEQCIAAGASDYLAKPLDVDKLVSLCRVWMAR
jgi:signal transduction histidine kinase/DNA-binding response OmpR family regulator